MRRCCRAQVLRPQNLVQLIFVRPAIAKSSDRFVAISVSSASRNDGLQTLHHGHSLHDARTTAVGRKLLFALQDCDQYFARSVPTLAELTVLYESIT